MSSEQPLDEVEPVGAVESILKLMMDDETTAEEVLGHLNAGMFDEWDCELADGIKLGFGGPELQLAARSAFARAVYDREEKEES